MKEKEAVINAVTLQAKLPAKDPGTAEAIKIANSEEWKALEEALVYFFETLKEEMLPKIQKAAKVVFKLYETLIEEVFINDPEVKKYYGIYKRTKKRRIKNKQRTKITKIIERYIKNEADQTLNKNN